jgi:hypothetical protein
MTTPATPFGENPMGSCHRGGTFFLNSEVRLGGPYRAASSTRRIRMVPVICSDFNSAANEMDLAVQLSRRTVKAMQPIEIKG